VKSANRLLATALVLAIPILHGGCAKDNTETTSPITEAQYVGSNACKPCHQGVWDAVEQSGHAHMLTPVVNAHKPGSPLLLPDNPPPGTTWAGIKYVIGGWGWSARFVGQNGNVVKGEAAQYNLPTAQYPTAESVEDGNESITPYDYACFKCHTTGPDEAGNTFAEPDVRCEACHGPGSLHAASPTRAGLIVDDSAELCGRCHSRADGGSPILDPSAKFVHNNDQYGEMKSGPHEGLKCVDCHAEHSGVRRDQTGGIVRACRNCHEENRVFHREFECITCHMPYATKSARSRDKYVGDVRTHIFKIHSGPEDQTQMFDETGAVKEDYGVTLDYVCYQCHKDAQGVGGQGNTTKTLQELAATVIHAPKIVDAH
jgi:predicted CXXCH cytochrome family protein